MNELATPIPLDQATAKPSVRKEPAVKRVLYGAWDSTKKALESQSPEAWGKRIVRVIDEKIVPKVSLKWQQWAEDHREGIREAATYAGVGITTAEIVVAVALTHRVVDKMMAPLREAADRKAFYRWLMTTPEGKEHLLDSFNPTPRAEREVFQKEIEKRVDDGIARFKKDFDSGKLPPLSDNERELGNKIREEVAIRIKYEGDPKRIQLEFAKLQKQRKLKKEFMYKFGVRVRRVIQGFKRTKK